MKICWSIVITVLLSGCLGDKFYNPSTDQEHVDSELKETNAVLHYLEIDEEGNYWDPDQAESIISSIHNGSSKNQDFIAVVFIHGWKHNASNRSDEPMYQEDTNRANFRKAIAQLAQKESAVVGSNRKIIGIYIGWRGKSTTLKGKARILDNLTFWGRKSAAKTLGKGNRETNECRNYFQKPPVLDLLSDIESIRNQGNRAEKSRLITIGHSFGALVLHESIKCNWFHREVVSRVLQMDFQITQDLGNLVVMLNPAFEASEFIEIYDYVNSDEYSDRRVENTKPELLVLASEGDWANRYVFPIGKILSLQWWFGDIPNVLLNDNKQRKWSSAIRTIGHYREFRTHYLCSINPPNSLDFCVENVAGDKRYETKYTVENWDACDVIQRGSAVMIPRLPRNAREYSITQYSRAECDLNSQSPFVFAYVDKNLIRDHNDIWSAAFAEFLYEYVQCIYGDC